jgi:hypothetical protein
LTTLKVNSQGTGKFVDIGLSSTDQEGREKVDEVAWRFTAGDIITAS